MTLNYKEMQNKINDILTAQKRRNLSQMGKILVVNTLIVSLFVYKMQVLPLMAVNDVKIIEKNIEAFLWSGHKPKIQLEILKKCKEDGGLGLVDLHKKDMSMKVLWVKIIQEPINKDLPEIVYKTLCPSLKHDIWLCQINSMELSQIVTKEGNPFWFDILFSWRVYNKKQNLPNNRYLWFNSEIKIEDKPIKWGKALKKGLIVNGLLSIAKAGQKFELTLMQCNALVSAIPCKWLKEEKESKKGVNENISVPITKQIYACLCYEKEVFA